ncbi:MAG: metallophosphoesterase family protein [Gemmataceae bacterium]
MRLGLLADIHENAALLAGMLDLLTRQGVDRFVLLGDVIEGGPAIAETVRLLDAVGATGVWGGHDYPFCWERPVTLRRQYGEKVLRFVARLRPRLEIADCSFSHVDPWLDAENLADLSCGDGPPGSLGRLARCFLAVPHHVLFLGHFHRWMAATEQGAIDWNGERPLHLNSTGRYLVVVHAVCQGWGAIYDTESLKLTPVKLVVP